MNRSDYYRRDEKEEKTLDANLSRKAGPTFEPTQFIGSLKHQTLHAESFFEFLQYLSGMLGVT